jgi:YHS domain-containing protein
MGFFSSILGRNKTEFTNMEIKSMAEHQHGTMTSSSQVKDPVCGMDVDPATAVAKSEYMGKTYYFCAPGCNKAFDADPAKYLEGKGGDMPGYHHGRCCC